jgi:hypothetical protein
MPASQPSSTSGRTSQARIGRRGRRARGATGPPRADFGPPVPMPLDLRRKTLAGQSSRQWHALTVGWHALTKGRAWRMSNWLPLPAFTSHTSSATSISNGSGRVARPDDRTLYCPHFLQNVPRAEDRKGVDKYGLRVFVLSGMRGAGGAAGSKEMSGVIDRCGRTAVFGGFEKRMDPRWKASRWM